MDKPHKRLVVWQRSIELVREIYQVTARFPAEERYGLTSQMRRAAVSIVSNIAEGAARQGTAEFLQFAHTALGSLSELDSQVEISRTLGFINSADFDHINNQMDEVDRLLLGLRNYLRRKLKASKSGKFRH